MPTYRITAPNGAEHEITAPDGASEQQVLDYARQQFASMPAAPAPAVKAPTNGIAMGLRDPVDAGAQLMRRIVPEPVGQAVDTFGNWLASKGLPVTPSSGMQGVDQIVKGVNTGYDAQRKAAAGGQEPGFDFARLGGNMLNPVNYAGGGSVAGASSLGQLAMAGARAGAVSGALQPVLDTENFWGNKAGQAAAGAAGGAVLMPIVARGTEAVGRAVQSAIAAPRGTPMPETVRVQTANVLRAGGMNPADVPEAILQSVQRDVQESLARGARLDPAAIVRRAQFEAVGLTGDAAPTLGQMTRDPMQFAQEKNLSGVRIRTPQGEGNPLADRFQLQNQRLNEVFQRAGAGDATDRVTAGQRLGDALRSYDEPVRAAVDGAYQNARSMAAGREALIDGAAFSQRANAELDRGMWGHYVPPEVRAQLNDITSGRTPLTVENSVQLDSIWSALQRRAERAEGARSPTAAAIGVIRNALHDAPMARPAAPAGPVTPPAAAAGQVFDNGVTDAAWREVPRAALGGGAPRLDAPAGRAVAPDFQFDMPPPSRAVGPALPPQAAPVDEGALAREAFDQARRAARSRFATIEATPALRAALDNEAPDRFVQQFILNAPVRDVRAMTDVLANDEAARAQARAQIAEHLRNAAFGANPSGDKAFTADRYMQTLRAIGPEKLRLFFSPSEVVQLNLVGRVASDINSIPAGARYGTNTSGTGAAVMNLLSKISESPALRQIPFGRSMANQIGEIRTEREMARALSPAPVQEPTQLSPEAVRALHRLMAPAGVAGGVLGGSAVN